MINIINSIKNHEGFKKYPYIDPIRKNDPEKYGITQNDMNVIINNFDKLKVTFGIGFTFLTEEEAELILKYRLSTIKKELFNRIPWIQNKSKEIQNILIEMSYQLGINGLLKFKNMLRYIKDDNYILAAKEGRDSLWYRQTTNRAEELMYRLEKGDI